MTTTPCPPPKGGSPIVRAAALIGITALTSLFIAACGGDSDSPVPPPPPPPAPAPAPAPTASNEVPASAAVSSASLESYAFGLALSDTTEPLKLDLVPTFPSSETDAPIPTP